MGTVAVALGATEGEPDGAEVRCRRAARVRTWCVRIWSALGLLGLAVGGGGYWVVRSGVVLAGYAGVAFGVALLVVALVELRECC